MIGIIDMKTNNINCFIKILKKNNFKFIIIKSYDDYKSNFNLIDKIIIPGIGSFNLTMNYLINTSLDKVILEHNENKKKNFSNMYWNANTYRIWR